MADDSPMLAQYRRIKQQHRDEILFFRLGDFYEMFAEDAVEVSSLIHLTLTSRNGLPMCGVPHHAARSYIARLLKLGKKIAVCEQMTQPGKGLVEREVVEIITPGTTVEEEFLDTGSANFIACLARHGNNLSFACAESSSGAFHVTCINETQGVDRLAKEFERFEPRELVIQESLLEEDSEIAKICSLRSSLVINRWPDWLFDNTRSCERLEKQFSTINLKAFGVDENSVEIVSAGTLLLYLDDTSKTSLPHIRTLHVYSDDDYLGLDDTTQRNLELVRSMREGDSCFTLFETLDYTKTAMGRRLLKRRILFPLRNKIAIQARLDEVDSLYRKQTKLEALRDILAKVPDLERLSSRLGMDKAHARDLLNIAKGLEAVISISKIIKELDISHFPLHDSDRSSYPKNEDIFSVQCIAQRILTAVCEEPALFPVDGKVLQDGYNYELDALRELKDNGHELLKTYLEEERAITGIQNLKIKYNRMIGYFFEVSKSNLTSVPAHFIRRQSLVNGERFTSERLEHLESDINGAGDQILEIEKRLFLELRNEIKIELALIQRVSAFLASIDTAQSLARAATVHVWNKPILKDDGVLRIIEGRHPVVEKSLARGEFVPNDTILDTESICFSLVTGPNMAGKSTYLRQTALITLLAQMGSFVPAREAEIGIVDKIFCRVGASDNLARGESTFLVEMNETANILRNATNASLLIMDEVGRGTGTKDGLSIAWAVCEDILDRIGCRCLFATHYHELVELQNQKLQRVCMDVIEKDGVIVFLKKLKEGAAEQSYGLHVASLAGVPDSVIKRSQQILDTLANIIELKTTVGTISKKEEAKAKKSSEIRIPDTMISLMKVLNDLNPDELTPMAALAFIQQWKRDILHEGKGSIRSGSNHAISSHPELF
jgi:DNA mismatch repair protein MutS